MTHTGERRRCMAQRQTARQSHLLLRSYTLPNLGQICWIWVNAHLRAHSLLRSYAPPARRQRTAAVTLAITTYACMSMDGMLLLRSYAPPARRQRTAAVTLAITIYACMSMFGMREWWHRIGNVSQKLRKTTKTWVWMIEISFQSLVRVEMMRSYDMNVF